MMMMLSLHPNHWQAHLLLAAILAGSTNLLSSVAFALTPSPPSWEQLRQTTPHLFSKPPPPVYYDRLPVEYLANNQASSTNDARLPILYRDKECICAASESVWLALECKNVNYITVLVSNDHGHDHDDPSTKPIPRIIWPDNEEDNNKNNGDGDAIQLLEQIQSRYPDNPPDLYPKALSAAVDAVRCNIMRLPGVMPRYSDPDFMSLAPYIFRNDGTLVPQSSHCVTLEEIEEMQEEYYLGKFLCGREVTAADMVWAPYLERYAIQLPLMFPNVKRCHPRNYDEVNAWYKVMETQVPAYACRVQGDARHWRRCLEYVVIPLHNARASNDNERVTSLPPTPKEFGWWMKSNNYRDGEEENIWKEYATESRPWLADTPRREVALYFIRNREDIVTAASSSTSIDLQQSDADAALREVVHALLNWKVHDSNLNASINDADAAGVRLLSENARRLARFACERIEVPRDMGMIPARSLGKLVQSSFLGE